VRLKVDTPAAATCSTHVALLYALNTYKGVSRVGQNHIYTTYDRIFGGFPAKIHRIYIGLAGTICIQRIYGIFGREITKYTVVYGVYTRLWPTLYVYTVYMVLATPRNEGFVDG